MGSEDRREVIIIGAGPVGLLTALRLGQAGIKTLVLESHGTLLPTTRAMVYMPVVIPCLRKLGILDKVTQQAFLNHDGVVWRDMSGKALAQLPLSSSNSGEFGGVLLFGQARMNALILEELKNHPLVEVKFGLRCVGIEDREASSKVKVMVHQRNLADEDLIYQADYVLGTDGANSAVRRMMCIPFEGFTYQEWKMIGCDVVYNFTKENSYTPLNFVVHPLDWAVIAYSGEDAKQEVQGCTGECLLPTLATLRRRCTDKLTQALQAHCGELLMSSRQICQIHRRRFWVGQSKELSDG